jgi:hypothetical protein
MTSFLISVSSVLQIFGVLVTLAAAAAMAYIEHNNLKPNKKNFGYLALFGGILALVGQYYSTKDNDSKTERIIEQGKKIDSLSAVNVFLSQGNSTKLDQSLSQLDSIIDNSMITLGKLAGQSDKLSNVYQKSKQIQDYNTGGSSFPVINVMTEFKEGYFSFFAENKGKYPLYNLYVAVSEKETHYLKRKKYVRSLSELSTFNTKPHHFEILKPNDGWVYFGDVEIPKKDSINFGISCNANNGGVYQTIIAMKDKYSNWKYAMQVKRGKKIIYEDIEPTFPYKQKNIKWDIYFGIPEGMPLPDSILDKFYPIKN